MQFSELIERDIYDTTILVQQASVVRQRKELSTIVDEEYQHSHLNKLLNNMIHNKEMLAGGFVAQPVPVNASLLESEYIPSSIYQSRKTEAICTWQISFPEDLSDYYQLLNIPKLSDLILAIESYDFKAVIRDLHSNFDLFNNCSSQYSGFLEEIKSWTLQVNPLHDELGNGFTFEEVAAAILADIDWYEENVLNPYKKNELTKLQLRDQLTDNQIIDLVTNAETVENTIITKFSNTIRALASEIQTELQANYTKALRYLANFQIYFPNKQDFYRGRAQRMLIWQIPTAMLETSEILSFQVPENEIWRVWPQYMDIQYFVDNQIRDVFKIIDVSLFDVIEDILTSMDGTLHDHVNSIYMDLEDLVYDLDSLRAKSIVNDEFVL